MVAGYDEEIKRLKLKSKLSEKQKKYLKKILNKRSSLKLRMKKR